MYLKKFKELHSRLKKRSDIEIHSFKIGDKLSKSAIKQILKNQELPSDVLDFYEQLNGFQLSYTFKNNLHFKKDEFGHYDQAFPYMLPNDHYWQLDGCINILPLDFMVNKNWQDYIWFDYPYDNKVKYKGSLVSEHEFEKELFPFDVFCKCSIVAIHFDKDCSSILLSTDHNACYFDYRPLNFKNYIDGILEMDGLIDNREKIFKVYM